jgi:hypothetical protein
MKVVVWHGPACVATVPSARSSSRWPVHGWAKRGQIVAENAIEEPGDPVHFAWGRTSDEVTADLLREMGATQ